MGIRQERLADEIRDLLAVNLVGGKMSDPRLGDVTVTSVRLSADLQIAYVYFRIMAGDDQLPQVQRGLESAAGYLRNRLAESLDIRRVPALKFFYDKSIEHGARIEELLTKI